MNLHTDNELIKGRKLRRIILFVFLGIILLTAIYGSVRRTAARFSRDFLAPFLKNVTLTEEGVNRSLQMTKPKRKLAAEIQILQRKNLRLEARVQALSRLEDENKTLRAFLKLPGRRNFEPVIAEITGRTAPLWRERFVINRGSADGVKIGNAVAAPDKTGNLVMAGRVIEVSAGTAVVATVFSGDCRISVSVLTDGSTGGLEVIKEKTLPVVRYLPPDGDYRDHGILVTSGIADGTPGGIPVASIIPRGKDIPPAVIRNQLHAELNVTPLVRIDSVRTVIVFTRKDGKRK